MFILCFMEADLRDSALASLFSTQTMTRTAKTTRATNINVCCFRSLTEPTY